MLLRPTALLEGMIIINPDQTTGRQPKHVKGENPMEKIVNLHIEKLPAF